MLKDIKSLTELYLHSNGLLPEDKHWSDFHEELIKNVSKEAIGLLADANPKDKCKYALFVDVDTKKKSCEVKDYIEIGAVDNWTSHLFWQGSGQAQSDKIRNTPHKIARDVIKELTGICPSCHREYQRLGGWEKKLANRFLVVLGQ